MMYPSTRSILHVKNSSNFLKPSLQSMLFNSFFQFPLQFSWKGWVGQPLTWFGIAQRWVIVRT